ncbi:MAG: outer membrane lipoprotein carrier protein LolA [Chitinophagales bacterium]|nr:outer membrane lipoprotein carrier protein LolA [Chitinophagales bacterium]
MKRSLLAIIMLALPFGMFAQSDANATKLLKTVNQKYSSFKSMSMDLTVVMENLELKKKEEFKSSAKIKGNKFRFQMRDETFICDGKTLWILNAKTEEAVINDYDPKVDMNPKQVFQLAEKDHTCYMGETYSAGGKNVQVLELVPVNKNQDYSKIKLHVTKDDQSIVKADIYTKQGMITTYKVSNFKGNPTLADSEFSPGKISEGWLVTDLRM